MSMPGALITGAASGIGAAVSRFLLHEGWKVTGLDRNFSGSASTGEFTPVEVDLRDVGRLTAIVKELPSFFALVHCAGFMHTNRLGELDMEAGTSMWEVHVRAVEIILNGLIGRMPDGGRIVLLGSRTAAGAVGRSQYAASKSALRGLARSWALELVERRITVNVVAPAATDTPMLHDPQRAGIPPRLPPMGRFIQAEEIAALIAFLLSPAAGSITGQTINICAGSSL